MIAMLRGVLVHKGAELAIIMVQGVGYEVFISPAFLADMHENDEVTVHTYMVVREDSLTLYGFNTREQRDVYMKLLSVKGVGPRVAFSVLCALEPETLKRAIANKDYKTLQTVPGIGKRSAERLVIDIGDKLGPPAPNSRFEVTGDKAKMNEEISAALVNLGYQEKSVNQVLSTIEPFKDASTGLRLALRELGKNRL